MASSFSFEIGPSSLPQLNSKGSNYPVWRAAWTLVFDYVELWDIVSNTRPRPTVTAPTDAAAPVEQTTTIAQWMKDDKKAQLMIISAVHPDITILVTTATSAYQAWSTLQNYFGRDTTHSIILQFRQLISMEYNEDDDLIQHLIAFH
ncbi:hypothetical protein GGI43DRAFT_430325 [Trichoderma evansii]